MLPHGASPNDFFLNEQFPSPLVKAVVLTFKNIEMMIIMAPYKLASGSGIPY